MKRKIKRFFLVFVIFIEIIMINTYSVQAFLGGLIGGSAPEASDIFGQMEERYHLNKDSIKDMGERFNVSVQKGNPPEVDLFFNPSSPKFGQKITALALPKFFKTEKKNLYFTWYLKHKNCKISRRGEADYDEKCDLNNDNRVNEEDWKIEAMRIIAQNGFIKDKADYESDDDNDGYKAPMGRANNKGKARCYVHDFESGTDYQIAQIKDGLEGPGNDYSRFDCEGTMYCTKPFRLSCGGREGTISVPEQDLGSATSSGGSGGTTPTGGSASVDLTIPEHEETIDYQSLTIFDAVKDSGFTPYCKPTPGSPGEGVATCPDGTTARCITDSRTIEPSCDFIGDMTARICGTPGADASACCSGDLCIRTNPTAFSDPGESGEIACTTQTISGDDIEQNCEHLFPDTNGYGVVGDGDFGREEEEFWGTNPHDPSTRGNSNNDEANVAGLGIDKFSWTYLPGDKVGVIVEGLALMPTKHDDASGEIMWALPNNIFEKRGDDECTIHHEHGNRTGGDDGEYKYSEEIKGYDVEIPFASVNINACLKYNLVDPMKGGQSENLDLSVDYYPKNVNKGDVLTLTADLASGDVDNNQRYYRWTIYGGNEQTLDTDSWTELSESSEFRSNNNIKLLEGLGMDTFRVTLNNFDYKYMRVYVEVEEYYSFGDSQDTTRSGRGDAIIPINAMSDNAMSLISEGKDICNNNVCQVLNGQIVEASLSEEGMRNFLWTLNGKPITYLEGDEVSQGNIIRFPVMGKPGDRYVLSVTANDTAIVGEGGNSGKKVILSKSIEVVKPSVKLGIVNSLDSDSCGSSGGLSAIRLGTYNDLSGNSVADCGQRVFEATRRNVTVPVNYYPGSIENSLKDIQWKVNGVPQNDGNIDLSHFPVGSTINVSFSARYVPSDREELKETWGVSQFNTSGQVLSDSIQIKVIGNSQEGAKKPSKIIAGLVYNLSTQLLFILKISLMVTIIIFASGMLLSIDYKKE